MISTYIMMVLLIISFTLNPFLKKQASHNVSASEFTLIYQILVIVFIFCYVGYLVKSRTCSLLCFKKMTKRDLFWTTLAVITGMAGSILLLFLIKKEEVSYLIPNIQGIVILLGSLIGYFIFKEHLDKYRIIGIILIFVGIITINYGKLLT
jgi:multidrug transporter EmrE-like cation transporter